MNSIAVILVAIACVTAVLAWGIALFRAETHKMFRSKDEEKIRELAKVARSKAAAATLSPSEIRKLSNANLLRRVNGNTVLPLRPKR